MTTNTFTLRNFLRLRTLEKPINCQTNVITVVTIKKRKILANENIPKFSKKCDFVVVYHQKNILFWLLIKFFGHFIKIKKIYIYPKIFVFISFT